MPESSVDVVAQDTLQYTLTKSPAQFFILALHGPD
jgi:hypothetical protein